MSRDFVLGLLVVPGALALVVGLLLLARALLLASYPLGRKVANDRQRAHMASVSYAARRGRIFTIGNVAVTFQWGIDHTKRVEAYDKLEPKRKISLIPHWAEELTDTRPT